MECFLFGLAALILLIAITFRAVECFFCGHYMKRNEQGYLECGKCGHINYHQ